MTLPEYLKSLSKAQKLAFADRLNALLPDPLKVSLPYLYLLEREIRRPATKNCWKYVSASFDAVTLAELRPELTMPQSAA